VRRFPTSKFEHFKRENLERELTKEGIEYFYLGKQLGGYRKGGYQHYVETKDFHVGLKGLMEIAKDNNAAIMCREKLPWRCHRRFIGEELTSRDWKVVHIIDKNKTWTPKKGKQSRLFSFASFLLTTLFVTPSSMKIRKHNSVPKHLALCFSKNPHPLKSPPLPSSKPLVSLLRASAENDVTPHPSAQHL